VEVRKAGFKGLSEKEGVEGHLVEAGQLESPSEEAWLLLLAEEQGSLRDVRERAYLAQVVKRLFY
jgi:hypothetical protein